MGVATTMAIIGGVAAASQAVAGAKQTKSANKTLANLKVPELINPANLMQVSTLGAEYSRELTNRNVASSTEALQGAGVRGLVGGLGRVQDQAQQYNNQVCADLDRQQKEIQQQQYAGAMKIMDMKEQRFNQDKSALSSQINQGNQQMWAGISGVAQAGMSATSALGSAAPSAKGSFNPNAVKNQLAPNPTDNYNSSSIFTLPTQKYNPVTGKYE